MLDAMHQRLRAGLDTLGQAVELLAVRVPTKGISLPFISADGSGVLFLGLAAELLASVGRGTSLQLPDAALGRSGS